MASTRALERSQLQLIDGASGRTTGSAPEYKQGIGGLVYMDNIKELRALQKEIYILYIWGLEVLQQEVHQNVRNELWDLE